MTKVEMYTLAYKQGFKGMVYTLTTRGVEDAENLAQDVYLKAWQKLSQFKGSFIEFKGWIASIRESTYKDFLRNRNTDAMGFAGTDYDETYAPGCARMSDQERRSMLAQEYESMTGAMTDWQRKVFDVYLQENMSSRAIAMELGLSYNKVAKFIRSFGGNTKAVAKIKPAGADPYIKNKPESVYDRLTFGNGVNKGIFDVNDDTADRGVK